MDQYISHLDSERFGIRIARIDAIKEPVAQLLNAMREGQVKLIISRVKCENIEIINELEANGFRLMDIQVTYKYELKNFQSEICTQSEIFNVREFIKEDTEQIVQIARESFDHYGHYAADPRLDKVKCVQVYEDWARRSCEDPRVADKIFVAEIQNEVIGYLSFKLHEKNGEHFAAGGMGAVAKKYRSLGAFGAIMNRGLLWGKELDLLWEEHNVITINFPVNRSFIKGGFKPFDAFISFHCWLD